MLKVIEPQTEKQFEALFLLRWEVLRKPWGKPKGSEIDELEKESIHAAIFHNEICLACGRLQINSPSQAQIRYMAVNTNSQGKGFGGMVLNYLELKAKALNINRIILQARDNAVPFYIKNGYKIKEKTFLLFDRIQHFLMEKEL